jgi:uncharacterized protein YraI
MATTTETTTAQSLLSLVATTDVNCRSGPGPEYPSVGALRQGQTAIPVGKNSNGSWFVIEHPGGGGTCWVWGSGVVVQGSIADLVVVQAPPTPTLEISATLPPSLTPKYTSCQDYPNLSTCSANPMGFPGCYWDTGLNRCMP